MTLTRIRSPRWARRRDREQPSYQHGGSDMTEGRTLWWGKDTAWHRRELIVELGEEYGPGGPMVMDVLCAAAKDQRAGGRVKHGFRAVARECFVTTDEARAIIAMAAEIGALDDLQIDGDGRRFTARVSGFKDDQDLVAAAVRQKRARDKAAAESAETPIDSGELNVTDRDEALSQRDDRDKPSPIGKERKEEEEVSETRASATHPDLSAVIAVYSALPAEHAVVVDEYQLNSICQAQRDVDQVAAANHGAALQVSTTVEAHWRTASSLQFSALKSIAKRGAQLDGIRDAATKAGVPLPTALGARDQAKAERATRAAEGVAAMERLMGGGAS